MAIEEVKLSDTANIRQGYQFRSKIITDHKGKIPVIQMANINSGKTIDWESVQSVSEEIKENHYLNEGDVLFCARGVHNYSLVVKKEDIKKNTIAVSQFLIIKPDSTLLLPTYLIWYLSQKEALDYMRSNTLMSTVPLINKKTLEEMMLPLPPLATQKTISDIYELSGKEKELVNKIQNLKTKKLNSILLSSITGRG